MCEKSAQYNRAQYMHLKTYPPDDITHLKGMGICLDLGHLGRSPRPLKVSLSGVKQELYYV